MNNDLKIIKNKYGEAMSKLCRSLFPSLLEEEGLLPELIMNNFAESHFLYNDIIENNAEENFRDYIYKLSNREKAKNISVTETPKKLLNKVGYKLYKCNTLFGIQLFKKYYAKGEELCTFSCDRLERCHVFFAVKKNVDSIKRENFTNPMRQDEYGTSVISIQFTRDNSNTLSIKNRYNDKVDNPDATFGNDLESIVPGLEESFYKKYGLRENHDMGSFKLDGYVYANDGRLYKYNYELNNVYYCPNNIIIDNLEVKKFEKEKYVVLDYFILDLVNKKLLLYDNSIKDSFVDGFNDINRVLIENDKESNNKNVTITNSDDSKIQITLSEENIIKAYHNSVLENIGDEFLFYNRDLEKILLPNVQQIGNDFLRRCPRLQEVSFPNVKKIGNYFIANGGGLHKIALPNVQQIEDCFMINCHYLREISLPNAQQIGDDFMINCYDLREISLPNVQQIGDYFMINCYDLQEASLPNAKQIGDRFMVNCGNLREILLPDVKELKTRRRSL